MKGRKNQGSTTYREQNLASKTIKIYTDVALITLSANRANLASETNTSKLSKDDTPFDL